MYEETYSSEGGFVKVLAAFLCVCVIAFLAYKGLQVLEATIFTDHAMTSHATQIPYIEECFENGEIHGPYTTSNGRLCEYASDGGENNYWRIFECHEGDKVVITQFKQGVNRLVNYMRNHGMQPVEGDPGC